MRWKSEKFPLRHHAYHLHQHLIISAIVIILPTLTAVEGRQDVLDVAVDDALAVQVAQPRQEAPGDLLLQLEALLASNHSRWLNWKINLLLIIAMIIQINNQSLATSLPENLPLKRRQSWKSSKHLDKKTCTEYISSLFDLYLLNKSLQYLDMKKIRFLMNCSAYFFVEGSNHLLVPGNCLHGPERRWYDRPPVLRSNVLMRKCW